MNLGLMARLDSLLEAENLDRLQQARSLEANVRTTKKKKKRKNKPESSVPARSPSPSSFPPRPLSSCGYQGARPTHRSPSPVRPFSALLRPLSASPLPERPATASPLSRPPPPPPGPAKTEKTTPKYTANSMKQPELGTYPGAYQSPAWAPQVAKEADPNRQELVKPITEGRFKHVLAVPAHVLAQSLYHPDTPGAQARVRQLQEELKEARQDRRVALQDKCVAEREAKGLADQLLAARHAALELRALNQSLSRQLEQAGRAPQRQRSEREMEEEQFRQQQESVWQREALALRQQLSASQQQVEELRAELRRALRMVVDA
ncbi:hypothetical protein V8C86DRAFT_2879925 [Haematococcus lacustris]